MSYFLGFIIGVIVTIILILAWTLKGMLDEFEEEEEKLR